MPKACTALFSYIEGWYNPRRRHSGLGYLSPVNFERAHHPANSPEKSETINPSLA